MIERHAAGGVVYRRAGTPAWPIAAGSAASDPDAASRGDEPGGSGPAVEVLMILDAYGHWALPKGGIEPGETPEAAALREIREETGIVGAIEAPLPSVRYRFRDGEEEVEKTVHYFLVRALNGGLRVQREELRDAAWLSLDEAIRRCTYENLVPTLEAARQAIAAQRTAAEGARDAAAAQEGAASGAAEATPDRATGEPTGGSGAAGDDAAEGDGADAPAPAPAVAADAAAPGGREGRAADASPADDRSPADPGGSSGQATAETDASTAPAPPR